MGFDSVSALTTIPSSNNNTSTSNNITNDKEYQQIQNILEQLGLTPTGDKYTDKSTLEKLVLEAQKRTLKSSKCTSLELYYDRSWYTSNR